MNKLTTYVDAWSESTRRVLALLDEMSESDWSRPTDCPLWDVRDVVAHLSALESEIAGVGLGGPNDVGNDNTSTATATYTEAGVRMRSGCSPADLTTELREAYEARSAELESVADDPAVGSARTPGGVEWDSATLLRNRAIDMWVHEQDLRRAVAKPGGFDGSGAQVAVTTFALGMPYVLGKKVQPAAGTTVVWDVRGPIALELAVRVGDDGRARRLESGPPERDATLGMDSEAFVVLATGRRPHVPVPVEMTGDLALCGAVIAAMAVTT